jgi:hypothetical protein
MITFKHLICLTVILLSPFLRTHAQDNPQPQPPLKYRMELVYIFEANPTEYMFVIGNSGFKSVDSLKKFLSTLPAGSILEWAPGCIRMGGEPLLSSEQDMEEFKTFCLAHDVKFVLIPSG